MARDKHNVCPLTITLPCNYVERMIHAQLSSAGVNQSPVSPWPRVAYGESIASSSKQKFARSEENRRRYPLSRMINDAEVELKTSMVASQEKGGREKERKEERERRGESRISRQFSELQV